MEIVWLSVARVWRRASPGPTVRLDSRFRHSDSSLQEVKYTIACALSNTTICNENEHMTHATSHIHCSKRSPIYTVHSHRAIPWLCCRKLRPFPSKF